MEYQALYRKYRPKTFGEIVGQTHIVKTLINQVKTGRVSHAYLFCGTRGTGKTSTAKILAKAINCAFPRDGEPCGTCRFCAGAEDGSSVNILEIDAASNNGVENIRDIREEVRYTPAEGSYKVYIIDEVHMLSQGAFNALLKTLEEPPAHVIFILATTEPQKVPATILSRCQRFDFHRIPAGEISAALKSCISREDISAAPEALDYIARLADGSMRDSLSILDQCAAFYYGEEITLEKVLEITGNVGERFFTELLDAILSRDIPSALKILDRVTAMGRDVPQFAAGMVGYLRNLMVAASVPDSAELLRVPRELLNVLRSQGEKTSAAEIFRLIEGFSLLSNRAKSSAAPKILMEVELIRLCSKEGEISENNEINLLNNRISRLEKFIRDGAAIPEKEPEAARESVPAHTASFGDEPIKPAARPPAQDFSANSEEEMKNRVEKALKELQPEIKTALRTFLQNSELKISEGAVCFECRYAAHAEYIRKNLGELTDLIEKKTGSRPMLAVAVKARGTDSPKEGAGENSLDELNRLLPDLEIK